MRPDCLVNQKRTSFGQMWTVCDEIPFPIHDIELMHFTAPGSSHVHDVPEWAMCTFGEGTVTVGDTEYKVKAGDYLLIEPGVEHWMTPKSNESFVFFLCYPGEW